MGLVKQPLQLVQLLDREVGSAPPRLVAAAAVAAAAVAVRGRFDRSCSCDSWVLGGDAACVVGEELVVVIVGSGDCGRGGAGKMEVFVGRGRGIWREKKARLLFFVFYFSAKERSR